MIDYRTSRSLRYPLVGLLALLTLLLTACGGSSNSEGVASLGPAQESGAVDGPGQASESSDPQEVLLEYTQCLRDEGFDVPDPDFNGSGPGQGRRNALEEAGIDPDDPEFQAAQQECRPILQSLQQRFGDQDRQALQEAALEWAQCMRQHGVDVPDPDFSQGGGPGGGGGPFGGLDRDDPDFQAANEECRSAFAGLGGRFGGGPGS
ncbi:MAG TPA: hypothetical protein VM184_06345 [Gaiellaceae bacterium]|nr:hypothetical protein [Gaiellaceae bacterium]